MTIKDSQRFYCPYQGCDSSGIHITGVLKHIRDRHFSRLPQRIMALNTRYVLKTTSGQDVRLDGTVIY